MNRHHRCHPSPSPHLPLPPHQLHKRRYVAAASLHHTIHMLSYRQRRRLLPLLLLLRIPPRRPQRTCRKYVA